MPQPARDLRKKAPRDEMCYIRAAEFPMHSMSHALSPPLILLGAVWLGASACSVEPATPADAGPFTPVADAAPAPTPVVDAAPPPPPFAGDIRSLRLKRSIAVRARPDENAELIGTVARDIRAAWQRVAEGPGCEGRWIELQPRGWVCEQHVEPSKRLPWGVEMPRLEYGEVVPGVYGKVTTEGARTFVLTDEGQLVPHRTLSGSMMVRRHAEATLAPPVRSAATPAATPARKATGAAESVTLVQAGTATATTPAPAAGDATAQTAATAIPTTPTTYWLIDRATREYLPTKSIRVFEPSTFRGARLGDETGLALPVGFPLTRGRASDRVPVYSAAEGGRVVRKLAARTPVAVLEVAQSAEGSATAYRIGEGEWVRASEMRLASASEAPPLTDPHERWFDIDLDQQVLIAYEGALPVYATLVSAGSREHPTETGVYRTWIKFAETDMADLAGESPYSVSTVPWSQFFAKDLALHTAYWHDTFGMPRSHGCINLSPLDARFLYFWSAPHVPPGWSMAHGNVDYPGSVVRIRSKEDPSPELQGYAKRVYEVRLAKDPA
jgi:hypothetical protein